VRDVDETVVANADLIWWFSHGADAVVARQA